MLSLRTAKRMADDWYGPTRDVYLAAFAHFWQWLALSPHVVPTSLLLPDSTLLAYVEFLLSD
jgi:hypothetical protein